MLEKLSERVSLLISETGFTYCNCLFIEDEVRTIIDTGANRRSLAEIYPEKVDVVLYSHHHYDHTRNNALFSRARVLIHHLDQPPLENIESFLHYNSLDIWTSLMPGYEFMESSLAMGLKEEDFGETWRIDDTFSEGAVFDLGHTRIEALHTPGHSAGHCSFWFPEEELLFCGDICLTKAGPWYGEVYASPDDMLASIDRIIALKPSRITSCHVSQVYSDVVPRLTEFKNRIFRRDERVYEFLKKKPADLQEMGGKQLIYKEYASPFVQFWEKLMLGKHLERLQRQKRVEEIEGGKFRAL